MLVQFGQTQSVSLLVKEYLLFDEIAAGVFRKEMMVFQELCYWHQLLQKFFIFISIVHHRTYSQKLSSGLLAVLETEGLYLGQPI